MVDYECWNNAKFRLQVWTWPLSPKQQESSSDHEQHMCEVSEIEFLMRTPLCLQSHNLCKMTDKDFILGMQILLFHNFVRIRMKCKLSFFDKFICDSLKKKVGASSLPCAPGNTVLFDGINSLGMFWLCHFPHRLCPHPNVLLTHMHKPRHSYAIKECTLFIFIYNLPYRDR